jgi:uncharacterized protein with HEPN domain
MRDDRVRLEDMLEAIRRVQRYAAGPAAAAHAPSATFRALGLSLTPRE